MLCTLACRLARTQFPAAAATASPLTVSRHALFLCRKPSTGTGDTASHIPRGRRQVSRVGLLELQEALGLVQPTSKPNPVLVAIDFEQTENLRTIPCDGIKGYESQLGIATLDTRELCNPCSKKEYISMFNYVTGPLLYFAKASNKYLFGPSQHIEPSQIVERLRAAIPGDRQVILVGHAIGNELKVLEALDCPVPASVVGTADTWLIAQKLLGKEGSGDLKNLTIHLGCSFKGFHSGGNDANFTLKAALLLAVKGYEQQSHATAQLLRQISLAPLPLSGGPQD